MRKTGRQLNVSLALGGLLGRLDRQNGGAYTAAKVIAVWEKVAGALVAGHTTGAHLRDGTLVVYVDNPVWANELSSMSEGYREGMNSGLGQESVKDVRFSVSKRVESRKRLEQEENRDDEFYAADKVEPLPLLPEEMGEVLKSTSAIPDVELREAAIRAMVKDLEWKKGIAAKNGS